MRFLWLSDSAFVHTGFASQSRKLCQYLHDEGHEVFYINSNMSHQVIKKAIIDDGEQINFVQLPGGLKGQYGQENLQDYFNKYKPDVFGTLLDSVTEERIIPIKNKREQIEFLTFKELYNKYAINLDGIKSFSAKIINNKVVGYWKQINAIVRRFVIKEPIIQITQKYGQTRTTLKHSLIRKVGAKLEKVTPQELLNNNDSFVQIQQLELFEKKYRKNKMFDFMDYLCPLKYDYDNSWIWLKDNNTIKKQKRFLDKNELQNFAYFLAGYLAEGCINSYKSNHRLIISQKDKSWLEQFNEFANTCFKTKGSYTNAEVQKLVFCNVLLQQIILDLCGKGSYNKVIPDFVFHLDEKTQIRFIELLVQGDGHILNNSFNKYFKKYNFVYTMVSDKLCASLGLLLKQLKIDFSYSYREDKKAHCLTTKNKSNNVLNNYVKNEIYTGWIYDVTIEETELFVDGCGLVLCGNTFMVYPWIHNINFSGKSFFWYPSDGGWFPNACDSVLKKYDYPVSMSKFGQEQIKRLHNINADYIPHGVMTNNFFPLSPELKIKNKIKWGMGNKLFRVVNNQYVSVNVDLNNYFVIGCVARNQPRKFMDRLIKSFALFTQARPNVLLLMHSDPFDVSAGFSIPDLAQRMGIGHLVLWTNIKFYDCLPVSAMNEVYNLFDTHFLTTCIPEGEKVISEEGIKNIEEIKEGNKVLTSKGVYRTVEKVLKFINNEKPIVEIKPMYCEKFKLTFDHNVLVKKTVLSQPEWIEASLIQKGWFLLYPRLKIEEDKKNFVIENSVGHNQFGASFAHPRSKNLNLNINSDFMRLLGLYVAEGCISQKKEKPEGIVFSINTKEKELTQFLTEQLTSIGLTSSIFDAERNRRTIRCYHSGLGKQFKQWFSSGARNKKIPQWIIQLPDEKLYEFIRGMWEGDGNIYYSKNKHSSEITYTTTSTSIAYDLRTILIKIGFIPAIKYNTKKRAYKISILGSQKFRFAQLLKKDLKESTQQKTWQYGFIDNDYAYLPVIEVKRAGGDAQNSRIVYDLVVEQEHNFCSHSFIIHNSGENEGFGIPTVESMSCGIPVCQTDYTSSKELVTDNDAGLVIKPVGDVDRPYPAERNYEGMLVGTMQVDRCACSISDACQKLCELYDSKDLREKFGKNGRKAAVEFYDWQKVVFPEWKKRFGKVMQ